MKTRTIKELLILLRDYLPENISKDRGGCICHTIIDMWADNVITEEERPKLNVFIKTHVPSDRTSNLYYYPYGELEPRMKFLNKLISEL